MNILKSKFFIIWELKSFIILTTEFLLEYYFHILNLKPLYFEFSFLLIFWSLCIQGLFLFSLAILILSGVHFLILIFAIVMLLCIFIDLIILKLYLILRGISEDKFAAQIIVTNIYIISVLKKLLIL